MKCCLQVFWILHACISIAFYENLNCCRIPSLVLQSYQPKVISKKQTIIICLVTKYVHITLPKVDYWRAWKLRSRVSMITPNHRMSNYKKLKFFKILFFEYWSRHNLQTRVSHTSSCHIQRRMIQHHRVQSCTHHKCWL